MGGQWRALGVVALAAALALSGCAAAPGSSPEALCELPITGKLQTVPDGGYLYTFSNGTEARLSFANGHCILVSANRIVPPVDNRSDWELGFLYDYYITELGPCLNGLGYPILAPPERAVFIESQGAWSPHDAVATGMLSGSRIAQMSSVCPPRPAGLR